MGLPLGPTFANIFMCFYEKVWLSDCPLDFKPIFYRRYVDDTFLLFRQKEHANLFLQYLNSKHASINFTIETEQSGKLSFLDTLVSRTGNRFETSVFRKQSFTGLGTSYFSYCSFKSKVSGISTLLHRAYSVCSNYFSLHDELEFLKNYFISNGFPLSLLNSRIKLFLSCKLQPKLPIHTASQYSHEMYFKLPFFGPQSDKLRVELSKLLLKFYPRVKFHFIMVNNFKIGSLFNHKDKLPTALRSSLVYYFRCAQCASCYVGSTVRALSVRVDEHAGRSFRTGQILQCPQHSNIRNHSEQCDSPINIDNFKIIDSATSLIDVRILESLHIYKLRPDLNDSQSAYPLRIVNR